MAENSEAEWDPIHPDQVTDPDVWEVINLFRGVDWLNQDAVMRCKKELEEVRELLDALELDNTEG